jgi:diguanylate cyclase (GGDEF)-like protein
MIGAHRDINAEKILLEQSKQESLSLQKLIDIRTNELNTLNIQLTQKIHEVERLATIDPVTSLANRYFFEQRIEAEVARTKRFYEPLSLIIIDIDHFKQINDQFGHATGDSVLTALANVILQNIREIDVAARWGGDELMIILPNTVLTDAADLAEKLRVLVGKLDVKLGITGFTCSFGVAQYSAGEASKGFTIRADAALYEAKESGRNLVSVSN